MKSFQEINSRVLDLYKVKDDPKHTTNDHYIDGWIAALRWVIMDDLLKDYKDQ